MTKETDDAINLVVQHFLLERESTTDEISNALESISASRPFESLGHAMFLAMLEVNIARLRAARASLIAQLPRGGFH